MKKKGAVIIVIVVIVAGFIIFTNLSSKAIISNTLSERSKEFIKSQSGKESELSKLNTEGGESSDTRNSTFDVDGCFSFKMLYRIYNERIQGECSGYYAFNSPKGSIVTYIKDASNIETVDSAEGVSFRRLSPEKYKERTVTLNGKEFLIFKNIDEPYESIAYYYYPGYYLAFVLKATTQDDLDKDFEEMLESIEITKNN